MDRIKQTILLLTVFIIGLIVNSLLTNFLYYDSEKQIPISIMPLMKSPEIKSPADRISEQHIKVYDDRVVLDIPGATWASFTDTNSMDPFLDEGANSIEIKPSSPESIIPGDIISYHSSITGDLIVHRVISTGSDENGIFYIVKGDNNKIRDPEKIRFNQIHGVLVAIIY